MSRLSALLHKHRYSFGIVGLCLVAAVVFNAMTSTGPLWLCFVAAAAIYVPVAIVFDHLGVVAEHKATKQGLTNRVRR